MKVKGKVKNFVTFREIQKEWMKDPAFRKARKEVSLEFSLIRAIIDNRIKKGVTRKDLALKAGITQSSIARFESGAYSSTLSFIQKLATAVGVKIKIQ